MKALIICSVHALCDISRLERDACNRATARYGIPAILTAEDHAHLLKTGTMLDMLNRLPGPKAQTECLVSAYLEILNDAVWSASLGVHQSVFETLLHPKGFARPTAFVSEYPLLTSNLVRSAALRTSATRLGHLTTPTDPCAVPGVADSLHAAATSLGVPCPEVDVLVAHQRDYAAARSLGMTPRFVEELAFRATVPEPDRAPDWSVPGAPANTPGAVMDAIAVPA